MGRKDVGGLERGSVTGGVTVVLKLLFSFVLFLKAKPLLKENEKQSCSLIATKIQKSSLLRSRRAVQRRGTIEGTRRKILRPRIPKNIRKVCF